MENCIFCKIIKGEIPANFICEGKNIMAFLNINPLTKGHVLVVPRLHCADIFDIKKEILSELIGQVQKISQRLKEILGADGVNLLNNSGAGAEQGVFHFHLHIIPRWREDGVGMNNWWQSKTKNPSTEELKELASELRF